MATPHVPLPSPTNANAYLGMAHQHHPSATLYPPPSPSFMTADVASSSSRSSSSVPSSAGVHPHPQQHFQYHPNYNGVSAARMAPPQHANAAHTLTNPSGGGGAGYLLSPSMMPHNINGSAGGFVSPQSFHRSSLSSMASSQQTQSHASSDSATTITQPPPVGVKANSKRSATKKNGSEPAAKKAATGAAARAKTTGKGAAAAAAPATVATTTGKRKMTPMAAFRKPAKDDEGDVSPSSSSSSTAKRKANAAEKFKRNSRACTYCQHLKMKCSGPTADGPCERCRRTGKECMVQERAPRRPWTKKKDLQIQQLTNRLEEMESMLKSAITTGGEKGDAVAAQLEAMKRKHATGEDEDDDSAAPASPLKPLEVPLKPAGPSPGAINSWLSLANAPSTPSATFELDLAYVDAHREQLPFVATGKVSPGEAVEMFRIFMHSCVVHTAVLDPEWHTVPRVGDASPFLFAVILYIASTYHRERRTLRRELHEEMNVLIGQAITTGPKSTEVVQAFLLLYQWYSPTSDPADDRAWLLAGIGIRMATELQLHKALSGDQRRRSPTVPASETGRERINRERCWLVTFLVDRSLSIAVGRLWTISDKAEVVRDSDKWYEQPTSRVWDRGISAFADLLKTTARQAEVLHSTMIKRNEGRANGGNEDEEDFDCDTMMRIMNDELENWRLRWLSPDFFAPITALEVASTTTEAGRPRSVSNAAAAAAVVDDCGSSSTSVNTDALDVHTRTMYYITKQASFRFNFAVLVLNSFGLQYCATRPRLVGARNYCVSHAVRAAQGLVKAARDGLGSTMTYAPHTQFTIVSFAVISLIKLSALVDEVVAQRLIEQVRSCVTFLESIAITSEHTPARLASLVRAMLRRREERKAVRATRSKRSESDVPDAVAFDVKGNDAPMQQGGDADDNDERGSDDEEEDDDDDDDDGKPNYAPGMAVHKLPQRSSRAVTPEGHHPYLLQEHPQLHASSASARQQPVEMPQQQQSMEQHFHHAPQHQQPYMQAPPFASAADLNALSFAAINGGSNGAGAAETWASSMSSLPHFDDADVESTLQSLGFMANAGSTGWQQMTADEILDDSFWLRLPERGTGSA